ncbi:hypothetical protein [Flagellimonas onchidii]|uniref:hypothetical protein n=1 Tax=Flagellimonas onchidii TaxID=2562684 RepID=UPI0010A5EA4E|nr:hypothetical protein [Allomuricauda onchidii]
MKFYLGLIVLTTIQNLTMAQGLIENIKERNSQEIRLNSPNEKIEFWSIDSSEVSRLKENHHFIAVDSLSSPEEDLWIYELEGIDECIALEGGFYSLFKNLEDIIKISDNYSPNRSYDPIEDFNYLGKEFVTILDDSKESLETVTGLKLNYTVDSLDVFDEYFETLSDKDAFLEKNKLQLLAYLGNTLIDNLDSNVYWEIKKASDKEYWEPLLINKESMKEIDITRWFLNYMYDNETRIIGLRGIFETLRIEI